MPLRDVQAIRADLRTLYEDPPKFVRGRDVARDLARDRLAADVDPLLAALDDAKHMRDTYHRSSMAYRNELRIAREQVAKRDAKLAAVLSECERADDTMRRQYAERNGYGAVPNALEVAALSRLVTAKVRELALEPALSLSIPTSRTCSAGIGGGETCDLPDGHEGPHSSDGIGAAQ